LVEKMEIHSFVRNYIDTCSQLHQNGANKDGDQKTES
jgi:hypothetical protein